MNELIERLFLRMKQHIEYNNRSWDRREGCTVLSTLLSEWYRRRGKIGESRGVEIYGLPSEEGQGVGVELFWIYDYSIEDDGKCINIARWKSSTREFVTIKEVESGDLDAAFRAVYIDDFQRRNASYRR